MLFPSLCAASAALLSLSGLVSASPQFQQASSSVKATSTATHASASTVSLAAAATGTTACNNSPLLCNRNYNNITHMGAHDSAFLRDSSTSFSTAGNQFYNATVALSAGIRLLQAQVHLSNGALQLCHTSCALLDGGSLQTFLTAIKTWMDANPNEVVTLLLVNSDTQSVSSFGSVFSSSGISTYGYTPSSTTGPITTWPTLQTLISANTRLVTFVTNISYDSSVPYLMPEFNYVFETAFGVTTAANFTCALDRPSSLSSSASAVSAGYLGLLNHFLDSEILGFTIPNVDALSTTNSAATNTSGTAGTHGETCNSEWGVKPAFILVDFFNVGPAIDTADALNGISGKTTGRTSVSTAQLVQTTSGAERKSAGGALKLVGLGMSVIALGNFVLL
ncbi:PLC-like phosphodiesterase [Halenospora varia]|nr:PLC-like phosphodiesterase [Halenospora varia]